MLSAEVWEEWRGNEPGLFLRLNTKYKDKTVTWTGKVSQSNALNISEALIAKLR